MNFRYLQLFILFFLLFFASHHYAQENLIVSSDWLSNHLNDNNIVLLQVGSKDSYNSAHIPGARYISFDDYAPSDRNGLHRQMPDAEYLVNLFENLGISNNSRIILYTDNWVTPTVRLYLTLDYIGLGDRTSILNGGIANWQNENKMVTDVIPKPAKGNISAKTSDIIATKEFLLNHLDDPSVTVIDARTEDFYSATAEMDHYPRPGHIKGAFNIQFTQLTEGESPYLFKTKSELKSIYENAFVNNENTTVAYCHIGQQASLVYFVGKLLGYNMKLYDGSFEEWSADEDCPVTGRVKVIRNQ